MSVGAHVMLMHSRSCDEAIWAAMSLTTRAGVIAGAAAALAADADALAADLSRANGRDEDEIWTAEIVPTLDALRWLARSSVPALAPRPLGRARLQWYFRTTRHELHWDPHGVVGVITPSNALFFLAVPQVAAALVAGNTVRWKPAPAGAAVARRVAAAFTHAGLPDGALEIVEGDADAARDLVRRGVDFLHFTGSAHAGRELARLHAEHGRPAVLELSGRHTAVVLADADLPLAARGLAWGKLANQGRNCLSVQLVLAERSIAPALVESLAGALAALARDSAAPPADARETLRLGALVADAQAQGADVVWRGSGGATLLTGVRRGMRVVDEEVQGLVLAVAAVRAAEDAVAWINASPFRLSASIWSGSTADARALARRLAVGQVWINEQLQPAAHPEATLAGRGASGYGASRGLAGLMAMATPKVISTTPIRAPRRHYERAGADTIALLRATVALAFARRSRRLAALGAGTRALARLARGVR